VSFDRFPHLWRVKSYLINYEKLRKYDFSHYEYFFTSYQSLEERLELDYQHAFNPELDILNNNISFEFENIHHDKVFNVTLNDQVRGKAGKMMRHFLVKNMHSASKTVYEMFRHWQEKKAEKDEEGKSQPNHKKRKFSEISDQGGGDQTRQRSKSLPSSSDTGGHSDFLEVITSRDRDQSTGKYEKEHRDQVHPLQGNS
jgi:hypothetical protein